jgi:hypothetical protein
MRPIIGVNGDCLWLCGDVCHSPSSLPAPGSHGKLRRMLTWTGVESNFRFVVHLKLKPASHVTRHRAGQRIRQSDREPPRSTCTYEIWQNPRTQFFRIHGFWEVAYSYMDMVELPPFLFGNGKFGRCKTTCTKRTIPTNLIVPCSTLHNFRNL